MNNKQDDIETRGGEQGETTYNATYLGNARHHEGRTMENISNMLRGNDSMRWGKFWKAKIDKEENMEFFFPEGWFTLR